MAKNVIVVDEKGNKYGATYPKRAKGLVKNGRARFIDNETICLACPPQSFETEDIEMSENTEKMIIDTSTGEAVEAALESKAEPTLSYVLGQIERIANDTAYIRDALAQLQELRAAGPGDICGQSKADAIAHVVDAREETNRRLLTFYEMLYKDIAKSSLGKNTLAEQLIALVGDEMNPDTKSDMLDTVRQILRENKL